MRIVTAQFMWRNFKYVLLLIFIAAAVLVPIDMRFNLKP